MQFDITPDVISFGDRRLAVRNIASIDVIDDGSYDTNKQLERNKKIEELNATKSWVITIVISTIIGISTIQSSICIVFFIISIFGLTRIFSLKKKESNENQFRTYNVNLMTNAGTVTALGGLSHKLAVGISDKLQEAISGHEYRTILVDQSKQEFKVESLDMSTQQAVNSPGAVVGNNTSSNIRTNVNIQGVQDIDRLIARISEVADAQERSELMPLLKAIRANLKDGSVAPEQASASYHDLLTRVGKYASTAKDIVELVLGLGKFF